MAVGYVSSSQSTESTASVSLSSGTSTVVGIAAGRSGGVRTPLSVSIGGVSCAGIAGGGVDGGDAAMAQWGYILEANNPGSGARAFAETWGGGADPSDEVYFSLELSGVDQTTPFGTKFQNTATALAEDGNVTVTVTGSSGAFAFCGITTTNAGASGNHILPTGFTEIQELRSGAERTSIGYITSVGSASEAYQFTASADGASTMDSVYCWVQVVNAASSGLSITPSGLSSAEAFGTAVIGRGAVSITPNGIASAEAFGTAVLSSLYTIAANAIATAEAFGTAVLTTGAVSVLPSGIATAEAIGAAVLSNGFVILPLSIESLEALGNPVLTVGNVTILPAGIASSEMIGAAIVGDVIIVADIAFINDLVQELVKDITGGLNG